MKKINVLDHGYVRLVDKLGDDKTVVNAGSLQKAIKIAYQKGYRVTHDGKLLGLKGNELTVKKRGKQRYPTFSVNVKDLTKSGVYGIPVHKFAAYCFYGDDVFKEGLVVRHLNANTLDISKENIILGTYSENERDKKKEVRIRVAKYARSKQRTWNRRFSDEDIRSIRSRIEKGETSASIARSFGVTKGCIHLIKKGENYADVK